MKPSPKASALLAWSLLLIGLGLMPASTSRDEKFFISLLAGYFIVRALSLLFALGLVWRSSGRLAITPSRLIEEARFDAASELTALTLWGAMLGVSCLIKSDNAEFVFTICVMGASLIIPALSLPVAWLRRTGPGARLSGWLLEKARPAAAFAFLAETNKLAAALLALAVILAYAGLFQRARRLERDLAETNHMIKRLATIVALVEELEVVSSRLKTRLLIAQNFSRIRRRLPGFLSALRAATRPGIEVRQLAVSPYGESSITVTSADDWALRAWLEKFSALKTREDEGLAAVSVKSAVPSISGSRLALTVTFELK